MVAPAPTVFEFGPQDNVVMVDVYNTTTPEVRNNLTSKLSAFGSTLSETFGAAGRALKGFGTQLSKGEINVDYAAQRIRNALGGSRGEIINLATDVQNSIYSELTGVVPGTNYVRGATDLFNQVGIITGQQQYIVNADRQSVSSILNFVSDLTNNPVFKTLDLGAEAALIGGLLGEVSSWGVPSLMDELLAGKDDNFRYSVYSRNSSSLLMNSNAEMMEYYIDQGMASALSNNTPAFADDYLSQYQFPTNTTPDQYPALHTQLMKIMNSLKPNWLYTQRGVTVTASGSQTVITPKLVTNLGALSRASKDAKTLLQSNAATRTAALIAGNFPKADLIQLAKTMYPLIAIR